jgi:hypothetical protein
LGVAVPGVLADILRVRNALGGLAVVRHNRVGARAPGIN